MELLSGKVRPRLERILSTVAAIDGEAGLVPEDWLDDLERIASSARMSPSVMRRGRWWPPSATPGVIRSRRQHRVMRRWSRARQQLKEQEPI